MRSVLDVEQQDVNCWISSSIRRLLRKKRQFAVTLFPYSKGDGTEEEVRLKGNHVWCSGLQEV